jgi:zinc protease
MKMKSKSIYKLTTFMHKRLAAIFFLSLSFFSIALKADVSFPQETSDITADSQATYGKLPNGVRYVIEPNHEPHDRVSIRMLVLSGSLMEKDDQRGLAHYLEHMAFNGSRHHPPGTLIEYFQRQGMNFGGDTNAYTTFDRTVYKIELPNNKSQTIHEGLEVFSDMADQLLFTKEMITKERPIILSEKRTRDSADFREFVHAFNFLLPHSILPKRIPIGETLDIEHATREQFLDLYSTWYRPERIIVIVAGDISAHEIIPLLSSTFSEVKAHAPKAAEPNLGQVVTALGIKTAFDPEPDASATTVSITAIKPYSYTPDTRATRLAHLKRDIAVAMLSRRLSILSKKDQSPFNEAEVSSDEEYQFLSSSSISLTSDPTRWQASLSVAEQELRRALLYGFTQTELDQVVANIRNALKQAVAGSKTRRSSDIADSLVDTLAAKQVFTSPEQDLSFYEPELGHITPEVCLKALRLAFSAPGRYVIVAGNTSIPGDAKTVIEKTYQESSKVHVNPPEGQKNEPFAYTSFGAPGQVVENRKVSDLDLSLIRFSNGVALNFKHTPFEANRIRISVRIGAGKLTEPKNKAGLGFYTNITFNAGGLSKHSQDDLERILAGKTVGANFSVNADAFHFTGTTTREDLLLEFQLLTARITDPGYRPEASRIALKQIDEIYNSFAHDARGPLETTVPIALANFDNRFGFPSKSIFMKRNLDEVKTWLAPEFAHGPIEIAVVGDIDEASVISVVAQTFGALPKRAKKPDYKNERKVSFPSEPFSENLTVVTEIPKGIVQLTWPTDDSKNVFRSRRLNLLASIMSDRLRLKVREQLGGAYSPAAYSEPSDTFTHYGQINAECSVAPDQASLIAETIKSISYELSTKGITQDELNRAKLPILTSIKESKRTNMYWLMTVLANCQEYPDRLESSRTRQSDYESVTKDEIDALAKRYLSPDKAFQVIVRPIKASQ